MRRLASLVAIFLLLSTAAPLLACVTGRVMSQRESACCRAMHGRCGDMEKMGCCKTEVRVDVHPQLASAAPTLQLHVVLVDCFPALLAKARSVAVVRTRIPAEHSPPGLVIARLTVLRI